MHVQTAQLCSIVKLQTLPHAHAFTSPLSSWRTIDKTLIFVAPELSSVANLLSKPFGGVFPTSVPSTLPTTCIAIPNDAISHCFSVLSPSRFLSLLFFLRRTLITRYTISWNRSYPFAVTFDLYKFPYLFLADDRSLFTSVARDYTRNGVRRNEFIGYR